ncbi:MAG: hypothetical protein ACE5G2_04870 [Candidatus Krumholzibacteriia bacterium]
MEQEEKAGGRRGRSIKGEVGPKPGATWRGSVAGLGQLCPGQGSIRRLVSGAPPRELPNTLNMTLPGLRGELLVVALGQHGISLSSGSACKSGSPWPTHVLLAMGKSEGEAHCAVRCSLSHGTSVGDIDATVTALEDVLDEMETTVRFLPCK